MIFFHVINWRTYDAQQKKKKKQKQKTEESMKDIANNQQMLSIYSGDWGWLSAVNCSWLDELVVFEATTLLEIKEEGIFGLNSACLILFILMLKYTELEFKLTR